MKSLCIVVLSMLLSCSSSADVDPEKAIVYFYGFEIERITIIHEEEIEELGCLHTANSQDMERALVKVDANDVNYERRDIRAKIEMSGKSYFVDREGVTRQGDHYFQLDKARFLESIEPAGPCE